MTNSATARKPDALQFHPTWLSHLNTLFHKFGVKHRRWNNLWSAEATTAYTRKRPSVGSRVKSRKVYLYAECGKNNVATTYVYYSLMNTTCMGTVASDAHNDTLKSLTTQKKE